MIPLREKTMIETHFFREPILEFGNSQKLEHPQDGLFLYGPVQTKGNPEIIHVGIVGALDGLKLAKEWLKNINKPIPVENPAQLHTSAWPGFQAAFDTRLETEPLVEISIPKSDIESAIGKANRYD